MFKFKKIHTLIFLSASFPFLANAANVLKTGYFEDVFFKISSTLDFLPPLLVSLAVLVLFFGIVRYFYFAHGDPGELANARRLMIWGVVGLVVMISIYGIVLVLQDIFGVQNDIEPLSPYIPTGGL